MTIMRRYMEIARIDELRLYRGDSTKIDRFDVAKTHYRGLFGPGIYLTTDPLIAGDYVATKNEDVVYPKDRIDPEARTTKDLLRGYANRIASDFSEKKFRDEWVRKNGYGQSYNGLSSSAHRKMDHDMAIEQAKSLRARLPAAIEQVRQELPTLAVQKLTTGDLRLIRKKRDGVISTFEVPDTYVARTLHADRPLPDDVMAIIKDHITRLGYKDLRDAEENFVSFDDYVKGYRERGTRYAWRDEDDDDWWRGGKGENPTLDDFMNGTHAGSAAFFDGMFDDARPNSTAFIKAMMDAGYVGLEYDGGKRVGQHVRGGGGRRHRAFVFWDSDAINSFRGDHHALPPVKRITMRSVPTL